MLEGKETIKCFSFYGNTAICGTCEARKRCKAVLVSHGMDFVASAMEEMIRNLPDDGKFKDTDILSEMVIQIMNPVANESSEKKEKEFLDLLEEKKKDYLPNEIDLGDV